MSLLSRLVYTPALVISACILLGVTSQVAYSDSVPAEDQLFNTPAKKLTRAQKFVMDAFNQLDNDDDEAALAALDKAIKADPHYALPYFEKGLIEYDNRDYYESTEDYTSAIDIDPNFADAYYNRSLSRRENQDIDGSMEDVDQAIALRPELAVAYEAKGYMLSVYKHDEAGAIVQYDKAIQLKSDDKNDKVYVDSVFNRGLSNTYTEQYQKAIADFSAVIEIQPDAEDAYENRGVAYMCLHQYEQAKTDFKKAVDVYTDKSKDSATARMWLQYIGTLK